MTTEVYVVTSTIQHMYDPARYFEVEGVAFTAEGARKIEEAARKRT
jgi:hypothetical protein